MVNSRCDNDRKTIKVAKQVILLFYNKYIKLIYFIIKIVI